MKYKQIVDGRWIYPIQKGYRIACCDCGLVHKMDFKIVDNTVRFRVFRDEDQSEQLRAKERYERLES